MSNCRECLCLLVSQSVWAKASVEQRREWLAADRRMAQARGLCRGCYLDLWKTGAIPTRSPKTQPPLAPHPCSRCGLVGPATLCQDCVDVLDRDELALWTA